MTPLEPNGPGASSFPLLSGWTPWPPEVAEQYRKDGWWRGEVLAQLLDQAALEHGDRLAVVDGERRIGYSELAGRARRLAGGLAELGIGRNDRVVVQLPNCAEFITLVFALFRLGALPVMALPPHRDHEIAYLVAHSEAVAYAGPVRHRGFDHLEMARRVQSSSPRLRHLLVTGRSDDAIALSELEEDHPGRPDIEHAPQPSDPALFLLSGGTTGLPKLIPRTNDDYAYNARASAAVCGFNADTVYLVALPIGHNFPLACPGVLGTFLAGGRVVLTNDPGPESAFGLIEREQVTATALVPALAIRWTESPLWRDSDHSSLQLVQVGGARLAPEVARRIRSELGAQLQQVFGMAEGLLNYTRLDDADDVVVGTQGRPLCPADEIRIVDENEETVPEGAEGELQTRGPYTIRGYYRADEHNQRAFTSDGYYRTGDVVRLHPSGNLVVEGRAKDLINRGGEKISAEEVENLALAHPSVFSCAAVAMPDRVLGERTCLYVVLRRGEDLSLEELIAFLGERRIAKYKLPERIERVDALPLTHVGKVDKRALREDIRSKLSAEEVHQGA